MRLEQRPVPSHPHGAVTHPGTETPPPAPGGEWRNAHHPPVPPDFRHGDVVTRQSPPARREELQQQCRGPARAEVRHRPVAARLQLLPASEWVLDDGVFPRGDEQWQRTSRNMPEHRLSLGVVDMPDGAPAPRTLGEDERDFWIRVEPLPEQLDVRLIHVEPNPSRHSSYLLSGSSCLGLDSSWKSGGASAKRVSWLKGPTLNQPSISRTMAWKRATFRFAASQTTASSTFVSAV